MINVKLVKTFEDAKKVAQEMKNCGAIECEYGENHIDENIDGIVLAMNHHGSQSDNPPPSLQWNVFDKLDKGLDNFIVSHIDLDTIFGIMWASKILRPTKIAKSIAKLVAEQDLKGFHYMEKNVLPNLEDFIKYRFLSIGYLISSINIEDHGETIVDVSRVIHKIILKIKDLIIDGPNEDLKNHLKDWLENKIQVAEKYLASSQAGVHFFITEGNINLLSAYKLKNSESEINIVYNSDSGILSIACFDEDVAEKYFGENGVITPLQKFYGPLAGGRKTVGGLPRDMKITKEQANSFKDFIIKEYINSHKKLICKSFA